MGVLTDTSVIDPAVSTYFDRMLLIRARPKIVHGIVAQRRSLKSRAGNTIKFRRIEALAHATATLVEGSPPGGKVLSKTDITATVQQYGDYVTLTDFGRATVEHDELQDANSVLSQQMAETIDILTRDVEAAGTNVFYGGTASSLATLTTTTHVVDGPLLDKMTRFLRNGNAKHYTRMIGGDDKVGTFPIRNAYWCIVDPDVKFTLEGISGYTPVAQYPAQQGVLVSEIGSYKEIRFLESTLAKKRLGGGGTASGAVQATGANADVHVILLFAMDAIGSVPLDGLSAKNIIKGKGSAGTADPLDQVCTSGWKWTGTNVRLNEAFMVRAEVTVAS